MILLSYSAYQFQNTTWLQPMALVSPHPSCFFCCFFAFPRWVRQWSNLKQAWEGLEANEMEWSKINDCFSSTEERRHDRDSCSTLFLLPNPHTKVLILTSSTLQVQVPSVLQPSWLVMVLMEFKDYSYTCSQHHHPEAVSTQWFSVATDQDESIVLIVIE